MKKIYNVMMLAAVAAAALVSCAKEMDKPEVAPQNEGIKVSITTGEVLTKTALSGAKSAVWSDGDVIGVMQMGTATVYPFPENSIVSGTASTATFAGTVGTTGTYYAVHPVANELTGDDKAVIAFPEPQHPSATSFDSDADILVSKSFSIAASPATVSDIVFKRLNGLMKVVVTDATSTSKLSGEHIRKVVVTSSAQNLTGWMKVDLASQSLEGTFTKESKSVTAIYDEGVLAVGDPAYISIPPVTLSSGETLTVTVYTDSYKLVKANVLAADLSIGAGDIQPITVSMGDDQCSTISLTASRVWNLASGANAWNAYYGGTAGTARNVAMDDEWIYIAETTASPKLWAISIFEKDGSGNPLVKSLPTTGVETSGQTFALSCPRVLKNTDPAINGGKDVLIVSSMAQSTNNAYLYVYKDGIDNNPTVITIDKSGNDCRLGDTFTVYGDYQKAKLFFGKNGGNGIVTFKWNGTTLTSLQNRLNFDGSLNIAAYYPYPGDILHGVFAQRTEYRTRFATVSATEEQLWNSYSAAYDFDISDQENYVENVSGYAAGYRFETYYGWPIVAFQNNVSGSQSYLRILRGATKSTSWKDVINNFAAGAENTVNLRRQEMVRTEGSWSAGNSGMDVDSRIINGDLYIVGVKQSIGLWLCKVSVD